MIKYINDDIINIISKYTNALIIYLIHVKNYIN